MYVCIYISIHIHIYTYIYIRIQKTLTSVCLFFLKGSSGRRGENFLCALLLLLLLILASLSVREFLSVSEKGNEILGLASFEYYKYYT